MDTLVELYDKEPLENVLAGCIFCPKRVVYLCDGRDSSLRKERAVGRLFQSRGLHVETRFYYMNTAEPAAIEHVLLAVARDYPGCVFDFTGGRDLVLLIAGLVCREKQLPGFYIDARRGRFINLGGCDALAQQFHMLQFCIENVLALSGARLAGCGHYGLEEIGPKFERQAKDIFSMVLESPARWAALVRWLQAADAEKDTLRVCAQPQLKVNSRFTARCETALLRRLEKTGALQELVLGKAISFRYADGRMMRSLQNDGIWLELACFFAAREAGIFCDVRTSVVVEWTVSEEKGTPPTRNEIDVMCVAGTMPVFISCKMASPSPLALSEIEVLCRRFGGEAARAVVVTAAEPRRDSPAIYQRSKDLGITLIGGDVLRTGKLAQCLRRAAK